MEDKGRFTRSIYTEECLKLIWAAKENGNPLIPYAEFAQAIGLDPQRNGMSYVASARNIALNQYGIVTRANANEGIIILNDEQIAHRASTGVIKKTRKAVRKAITELTCVKEFNAMSNQAKIDHNMGLSLFGVIEHMTKPKKLKVLESKVEQKTLNFRETIKLFAVDNNQDDIV